MEQLMGIGALSSAIRQKLCEIGMPCDPEKGSAEQVREPLSQTRRTSYRHCWSGHAKGTSAIELPEASGASGCKRGSPFSMILKTWDLRNRATLDSSGTSTADFSLKSGGEKPYHQVRTPFPSC